MCSWRPHSHGSSAAGSTRTCLSCTPLKHASSAQATSLSRRGNRWARHLQPRSRKNGCYPPACSNSWALPPTLTAPRARRSRSSWSRSRGPCRLIRRDACYRSRARVRAPSRSWRLRARMLPRLGTVFRLCRQSVRWWQRSLSHQRGGAAGWRVAAGFKTGALPTSRLTRTRATCRCCRRHHRHRRWRRRRPTPIRSRREARWCLS